LGKRDQLESNHKTLIKKKRRKERKKKRKRVVEFAESKNKRIRRLKSLRDYKIKQKLSTT